MFVLQPRAELAKDLTNDMDTLKKQSEKNTEMAKQYNAKKDGLIVQLNALSPDGKWAELLTPNCSLIC